MDRTRWTDRQWIVRTWTGRNGFAAGKHFFVTPGLVNLANRGGRAESGCGHAEWFTLRPVIREEQSAYGATAAAL